MRILIVDDSSTMRRIIGNVVQQLGVAKDDFDEAEDGVAAWKLLEGSGPAYDVILTDWNMPNMNGLELVKKIRAGGRHQKNPIVMITTEGGKGEVITALKAGVNNYIVKPFSAEILKEKLDGLVKA
ncbi:MAG: response regulator [Campylobacterota bacterium]|nr:response regulator [Campylobacterota bacterium]